MKKFVAVALVAVMCLSLCACGKSQLSMDVDEAIAAIGEVTVESGDAISHAENLYAILSEWEKKSVERRADLVTAREVYEALLADQGKVRAAAVYSNYNFAMAADEAIEAIGEVTIESGEAIAYAEKLYSILTDREKEAVSGRLTLINARETYNTILAEQEIIKSEEVYNNAKDAYTKLKEVSKLCEKGMDDIYDAWHFGIYTADDAYSYFSQLSNEVSFSYTQLKEAAGLLGISESKAKTDWQYGVFIIETAQVIRGDHNTISKNMEAAQKVLQSLTEEFDDYTYYPKLKEYYSAIGSYVEFYLNPTGSFDQLAQTVNQFENNIRTLDADIAFLFTK